MASGHSVALLDADLPDDFLVDLTKRYRPWAVVGHVRQALVDRLGGNFRLLHQPPSEVLLRTERAPARVHPDLALLLATSGTTGSPKLVRLSGHAVRANARAIADALEIGRDERGITALPIHYTYGLSILHSHLAAGATMVLSGASVVERLFWDQFRELGCTSLAGVPYTYHMLRRLRFDPASFPSLRYATQAGGRLSDAMRQEFHGRLASAGRRFYIMYGQTEATARMAVMPPSFLPAKVSGAGLPIAGGRFTTRDITGLTTGEIVFHGPNVMMGYAQNAEDLVRGDDLGGTLMTGDLGYLDSDGVLFVTGRLKRIAKVFGTRVNLDDIEELVRSRGPVAAIEGSDNLVLFCEFGHPSELHKLGEDIAAQLRVHQSGVKVVRVEQLPLTPSGKVDYSQLQDFH
jgi:acyl-CoA synthetase (AMP-forming)/AMP-acid ligase II